MGRVLGFVVVVCLLAAAAFGGWRWWEQRAAADPDALPALTKDDATRAYLAREGKVVADMFDLTPQLVTDEGSCEKRIRTVLIPLASPDELSVASGKVPDPTARDLALAHVGLLTEYVASCKKQGAGVTNEAGERLTSNKESFDELMGADQ